MYLIFVGYKSTAAVFTTITAKPLEQNIIHKKRPINGAFINPKTIPQHPQPIDIITICI